MYIRLESMHTFIVINDYEHLIESSLFVCFVKSKEREIMLRNEI